MAGLGRGVSRGGKRGSSSSPSSYCSVTTVAFVAFSLLAVWVLSSSTFVRYSARTGGAARVSLSSAYFRRSSPSFHFKSTEQEVENVETASDDEPPEAVVPDLIRREDISRNGGRQFREKNQKSEVVDEEEQAAEENTGQPPDPSLDEEIHGGSDEESDHPEITHNDQKEEEQEGNEAEDIAREPTAGKTQQVDDQPQDENESQSVLLSSETKKTAWELCNATAGPDYIPCLDNTEALRHISTRHYEHRERHCPAEAPICLVPLPTGYKRPLQWPRSRDKIWYKNVPHTKLAVVKGHQNWVKVSGEHLIFPGGGTQFIHGALHYIDFIQRSVRDIVWGKRTRVVLDVGCGVASFGGYLFERDVLTLSFAPKDEHEAQVQFALERGIPAISAVMGSQRLPFPSNVFDLVHCARCRVPWHAEGGTLLLELNRVLRPGGYFVWSATPVYQKLKEDVEIWKAMLALTKTMCWELVIIRKDRLNSVAAAFFRKPVSNECYQSRPESSPGLCQEDDDPDVAWYVALQTCIHKVPTESSERASLWPEEWPKRLSSPPHWLNSTKLGVYGKPAPEDFVMDYERWTKIFSTSYTSSMGIDWSKVRNAMDMKAVYGGFAAALKDLKIWVMNVVDVDSPETLPIIFHRGLFGIYHDWCESFSTYPRTYDLLHADRLFSSLKERCRLNPVVVEIDRVLRPGGILIVRDEPRLVNEVEGVLRSLHWEVRSTFSEGEERILLAEKSGWRPEALGNSSS